MMATWEDAGLLLCFCDPDFAPFVSRGSSIAMAHQCTLPSDYRIERAGNHARRTKGGCVVRPLGEPGALDADAAGR